MNFKYYLIIPIILFLSNCSNNVNLKKFTRVENFSNKGFTLVFEDKLYNDVQLGFLKLSKNKNKKYIILDTNKLSEIEINQLIKNKINKYI